MPDTDEVQIRNGHDLWVDGRIVDTWIECNERWYEVVELADPEGRRYCRHEEDIRRA